jgi:hypothetical protein
VVYIHYSFFSPNSLVQLRGLVILSIRGLYGPSINCYLHHTFSSYTPHKWGKFLKHPPNFSRTPQIFHAHPKFFVHPLNFLCTPQISRAPPPKFLMHPPKFFMHPQIFRAPPNFSRIPRMTCAPKFFFCPHTFLA